MNRDTAKPTAAIPWYLILLQGILSILVGFLLITSPGSAMTVLVRLLGWYWLIKGIFALGAVFQPEAKAHRGWLIFNGIIGVIAGLAVLDHPLISAVFVPSVLVTFIGIAGIMIGVNDLLACFRGGGWSVGLLGIVSVILGGALLANTIIGVALLPYVIGITELVGGTLAIIMSFWLRSALKQR